MKKEISVLIADAQFLTRRGLVNLISEQDNISVLKEVDNREELFKELIHRTPDVLILDYGTEDFSPADIDLVREKCPAVKILVISDDEQEDSVFRVLEMGVNSFLTKNCGQEEIVNAILATAKNEKFFCNKVLDIILHRQFNKKDNCQPSVLTVRETEIVELIAAGITTKDIADQLSLSTHTVYTHRKNIMKKLRINSVSEMILYAVNQGLVKAV